MVNENEQQESLPVYQFQEVAEVYYPYDYQQPYYYQPQIAYPYNGFDPNKYPDFDPQFMYQMPPQQDGGTANTNNVMQQFLDENGNVDIQKMLSTVGQLADTVQQVTPVIRQLNDLVRSFRA